MRFLILNQHFPPDQAPTGVMLEVVLQEMMSQGHEVKVLCSAGGDTYCNRHPSTPVDSIPVVRIGAGQRGRSGFPGKLMSYAAYYLRAAARMLNPFERFDRVIALTTPPYLSLLARMGSKIKGADHAHWVMDLYPDVMLAHGIITPGGWKEKILKFLTCVGFGGARCAGVLSLGPDMEIRVRRYLNGNTRSEWIALWGGEVEGADLDEKAKQIREERGWGDKDFVVMYSGNLGLGHLFDEVLEVARGSNLSAGRKEVHFTFHGGGKRRVEIERFQQEAPDAPVELHGYEEKKRLNAHLRSADVHLVSLNPAWDGTMVPSKLQGIFAVGRPVILVGSEDSSIGQWICESGGGWVVRPGDSGDLKKAIQEAGNDDERLKRGRLALEFSKSVFSRESNSKRYAEAFTRDA